MPQISSFPELPNSTVLDQNSGPENPHGPPHWAKIKVGSWLVLKTKVKKAPRHFWSGTKCLTRRLPNTAHGPPDWAKVKSVPVLVPESEGKEPFQPVSFVPVQKLGASGQGDLVHNLCAQSLQAAGPDPDAVSTSPTVFMPGKNGDSPCVGCDRSYED